MKRLALLFCLLIPLAAQAVTTKTVYVKSDAANNGDGTTHNDAASPGAAGAYNSLANAFSGEATNLVTADRLLVVKCLGASADSSTPTWTGFTTDATRRIQIKCDDTSPGACHSGVWSTSKYRKTTSGHAVFDFTAIANVDVIGIQAENTGGAGDSRRVFDITSTAGTYEISGNLIRYSGAGSADPDSNCIHARGTAAQTITVYNNIISGCFSQGIKFFPQGAVAQVGIFYNNTIVNAGGDGFNADGDGTTDSLYQKNNLVYGSTGSDYSFGAGFSTTTQTTNASEDATSPNVGLRSRTFSFVSGSDFHLGSGDTGAKDQGTDLSGDAQKAFSTDIDGVARAGTWDVGADELTASGKVLNQNNITGGLTQISGGAQ